MLSLPLHPLEMRRTYSSVCIFEIWTLISSVVCRSASTALNSTFLGTAASFVLECGVVFLPIGPVRQLFPQLHLDGPLGYEWHNCYYSRIYFGLILVYSSLTPVKSDLLKSFSKVLMLIYNRGGLLFW